MGIHTHDSVLSGSSSVVSSISVSGPDAGAVQPQPIQQWQMNALVDSLPSPRPAFQREEIVVGGEAYDVYFRDIIACIRALYSEPEFAAHLVFLPEQHYADPDKTMRLYHDMHNRWGSYTLRKSLTLRL